ncbi:hypothetical protein JTE90_005718 [Oedothorax gibbosus]|uniref:Uncharacterized protein n=1 Tax=Oedothorax gibbosus TaxID=931172 RepID=A0AAV6UL32_9ARAC|nr:hypothetical protein JTE90_005718 [Oedothorax gibbosus]
MAISPSDAFRVKKKEHRSIALINHSRTCSSARENAGPVSLRGAFLGRFIRGRISGDISFYMQKTHGNDGNESVRAWVV